MTATLAARTAGLDPDLIPFTAVLSLIRGHIVADTCCPHCGKRPASGNDPITLLIADILAQPRHRQWPARTSGRTPFQRQNRHTGPVEYTITIVPSNLPQTVIRPGSQGQWAMNWSRRYKANLEKLGSGDLAKVAEVVSDLEVREHEAGLSAGEKRMLDKARQMRSELSGE